MDISMVLACIGAGISFYGVLQYVKGILYDGTKPRMASWAAWCTANSVFTIIAMQESAWLAAAINGFGALSNALVIGVSMRSHVSMRPKDRVDWACLVSSILCVICIVVFPDNKVSAALFAIAANLIATTPTFRHAWKKPKEETWQLFAANVFANGLGVVGVVLTSGVAFVAMAGPLVSTFGNLALVGVVASRAWLTAGVMDEPVVEEDLAGE